MIITPYTSECTGNIYYLDYYRIHYVGIDNITVRWTTYTRIAAHIPRDVYHVVFYE